MPGFVRTPRDEHLWSKAKARAAAEGHTEDWAYITGIFKHMKGGNLEKSAAGHLGKVLSNIRGLVSGTRLGGLQKHLIRREAKYRHIDESVDEALKNVFARTKALHIARKHGVAPGRIAKLEGEVLSRFEGRSKLIDKLKAVEPRKEKAQRLLDKFQRRSNLIRNIGTGVLATGAGAGVYAYKKNKKGIVPQEQAKTAEEEKKVNWKRLIGMAALSGAAIGTTKGFFEKRIEKKVGDWLVKRPHVKIPEKIRTELPWAVSRGVTGGVGATAGATSLGLSLRTKKKQEEKKS